MPANPLQWLSENGFGFTPPHFCGTDLSGKLPRTLPSLCASVAANCCFLERELFADAVIRLTVNFHIRVYKEIQRAAILLWLKGQVAAKRKLYAVGVH